MDGGTENNDLETVLKLMADDVVFMVPGQEPFGKEQFAVLSKNMEGYRIDGTSEVQEIQVLGDWAWMRKPDSRHGPPVERRTDQKVRLYANDS